MTDGFHEGYEYNTITCLRSAIFTYYDPIQGVSVGQNDRFFALFSGIFNNRPTEPKFNFIWDVKEVLDFLLTLECARIYH